MIKRKDRARLISLGLAEFLLFLLLCLLLLLFLPLLLLLLLLERKESIGFTRDSLKWRRTAERKRKERK